MQLGEAMSVTLRDVALKAGVSMKTVSRVINNETPIAPETRERVLQVIEAMGYAPHEQARRLAAGKTRSITLHFPLTNANQISNPLELNFVIGTAMGAADENYFFNLLTNPLTPGELLQIARGAQADGLILMQINMDDWRVNFLKEQHYPFVMIGRCQDTDGLSFIDFDFENAIQTAFSHLIELGHQKIGFLTYPVHLRESGYGPVVRAMWGYQAVVEKFSLQPIYREVDLGLPETTAAASGLFAEHPDLSGIVTMYHTMSVGVLKALQSLDRGVPGDCSIVAVGIDHEAELVIPPLTGVEWTTRDVGFQAAKLLIRSLKDKDLTPKQILVPPNLIVRESTADRRHIAS